MSSGFLNLLTVYGIRLNIAKNGLFCTFRLGNLKKPEVMWHFWGQIQIHCTKSLRKSIFWFWGLKNVGLFNRIFFRLRHKGRQVLCVWRKFTWTHIARISMLNVSGMPNPDKLRNQDDWKSSLDTPKNPEKSQDLSKSIPEIQNLTNYNNASVDWLDLFRPNKPFRRICAMILFKSTIMTYVMT